MRGLAGLFACCRVRRSLHTRLTFYKEGGLGSALATQSGLPRDQIKALNSRLAVLLSLLAACIDAHGEAAVLVDDGF